MADCIRVRAIASRGPSGVPYRLGEQLNRKFLGVLPGGQIQVWGDFMSKSAILGAIAAAALGSLFFAPLPANSADAPRIALMGQVTSEKEGPMEGVLVGAKKDGSAISINVFTDDKGHYGFPSSKLGPGHYTLKIRAVGYELDGAKAVDLASGAATTADIKLRP